MEGKSNLFRKAIKPFVIFFLIGSLVGFYLVKNKEKITTDGNKPVVEEEIVGASVKGRKIKSYTYGNGEDNILLIGGIHGGYEWNSVLLAYQFIDYLENNTDTIPENISVSIIPNANPDGTFEITQKEGRFSSKDIEESEIAGTGRFNANDVDLNRNFDCKWKPESTWRGNPVSAGTSAFSEPEAEAIRDFVAEKKPVAVIFFHSQSNAVYASECESGILPETIKIMNAYSNASGYPAVDSFDAYEITGDAEGWLASIDIPAITVELSDHESIEWSRNLNGLKAVLKHFGTKEVN